MYSPNCKRVICSILYNIRDSSSILPAQNNVCPVILPGHPHRYNIFKISAKSIRFLSVSGTLSFRTFQINCPNIFKKRRITKYVCYATRK